MFYHYPQLGLMDEPKTIFLPSKLINPCFEDETLNNLKFIHN